MADLGIEEELARLKELREKNILTEEEFEENRAELLGERPKIETQSSHKAKTNGPLRSQERNARAGGNGFLQQKNVVTGIVAVAVIAGAYFLFHRGANPPGCDAEETKELVYQITKEQLDKPEVILFVTRVKVIPGTFLLDAIRVQGQDPKTEAYSCAGKLQFDAYDISNKRITVPPIDITYMIEKTTKDGEFYVTVSGL